MTSIQTSQRKGPWQKKRKLKNRKTYKTRTFFNTAYKIQRENPQDFDPTHHDTINNEFTNTTNTSIPAQENQPRIDNKRGAKQTSYKKPKKSEVSLQILKNKIMSNNDLKGSGLIPSDEPYLKPFLETDQTKRISRKPMHKTKLYINSSLKARKLIL